MSLPSITGVVKMLRDAGFQAVHAFPSGIAAELTEPMVAVSLQNYDTASRLMTARAQVRCPKKLGGSACEETAMSVVHALSLQDARCRQGVCVFDKTAGQFYVNVEATWSSVSDGDSMAQILPFQIQRDGVLLPRAIGFTAKRLIESETVGVIGEEGGCRLLSREDGWELTVEELFFRGKVGEEPQTKIFSLDVVRNDGAEFYRNCHLISLQRKDSPDGVKQTTVCRCWDREVMTIG